MYNLYKPLSLTEENWEKHKNDLASFPLRVSKFRKLDSPLRAKAISLKYVQKGVEKYQLGKSVHTLSNNQFVINNKYSNCEVFINENQASTGICIDLDELYFSDILESLYQPNDIDNLHQQTRFFLSEELYCQGAHADTLLCNMLNEVVAVAEKGGELFHLEDFLKNISYQLIISQQKIIKEYNNVDAIKISTKKELYARLLQSQNMMQDFSEKQPSIKEIAQAVYLSEFRFHHLFKATFGITPHQYQTQILLNKSVELHKQNHFTWTEIAEQLGYADIQTFGKVFKKYFGVSPKGYEMR